MRASVLRRAFRASLVYLIAVELTLAALVQLLPRDPADVGI